MKIFFLWLTLNFIIDIACELVKSVKVQWCKAQGINLQMGVKNKSE